MTEDWIKQNVILFSHKKEGNSDICYSIDEPWGIHAIEISHQKNNIIWLHLREVPKVVNDIETEIGMVAYTGLRGWGIGSYCLTARVSVLHHKETSRNEWWWWLRNSMNALNSGKLKNVHSGKFYIMHILQQ